MNPFFELLIEKGLVFDTLGLVGLGLIALGALRLARCWASWGGAVMAGGALALLLARMCIIGLALLSEAHQASRMIPEPVLATMKAIPTTLLTLGVAGVVWGLWGHCRLLTQFRN